jgi:hypothetical protein
VRAARVTDEETTLARSGRQPPRFIIQPQDAQSIEGEPVRLRAKAEGVPLPKYEWFSVDRADKPHAIANGTDAVLLVQNPPLGLSRYIVRASNSQGEVKSEVATLSVEQKLRFSQPPPSGEARGPAKWAKPSYVKSEDDIERDRRRWQDKQEKKDARGRQQRNNVLTICSVILGLAVLGGFFLWWKRQSSSDTYVVQPTCKRRPKSAAGVTRVTGLVTA